MNSTFLSYILVTFVFNSYAEMPEQKSETTSITIRDREGYFQELQNMINNGEITEKNFIKKYKKSNEYYSYSFDKDVELLGVKWPQGTSFNSIGGYAIKPSKDILIKGYLVKGNSGNDYEVGIWKKDFSIFRGYLGKDTEMTIKDETRICPEGSQFYIEYNKPARCCMKRKCTRDEAGLIGFFE